MHHGLVGAAVQRALQRADGAGDGGVDVGEGGCDDACGEGGGVQFVVGVQDEGDVESFFSRGGGLFAVQHPEEVGRVREGLIRRDHRLALANAVEEGDEHGDLRGEPVALAHIGLVGGVLFIRVVDAEQGDGGAQDLHRRGVLRDALQEVDDRSRHLAGGGQLGGECGQLFF